MNEVRQDLLRILSLTEPSDFAHNRYRIIEMQGFSIKLRSVTSSDVRTLELGVPSVRAYQSEFQIGEEFILGQNVAPPTIS